MHPSLYYKRYAHCNKRDLEEGRGSEPSSLRSNDSVASTSAVRLTSDLPESVRCDPIGIRSGPSPGKRQDGEICYIDGRIAHIYLVQFFGKEKFHLVIFLAIT